MNEPLANPEDLISAAMPAQTLRGIAFQVESTVQRIARFANSGGRNAINVGGWRWGAATPLPPLPPVVSGGTFEQREDLRTARSLERRSPKLLQVLALSGEILVEAAQGESELRAEGFTANALANALAQQSEEFRKERFGDSILEAAQAAGALTKARRDLASLGFRVSDGDGYLRALELDDPGKDDGGSSREAASAAQTAVYDMAIANKLKPLSSAERALVLNETELPRVLDDDRVLAALFRSPRAMLPFDNDEMRAIASMAFVRTWPQTALIAGAMEKMAEGIRPVVGRTLLTLGKRLNPNDPYEAFMKTPGGRWALEPLAPSLGSSAMNALQLMNAAGDRPAGS